MISEELKPLLDKLEGYGPLFHTLADGRVIWLEIIADENRTGRDWCNFSVDVNDQIGKPLPGRDFRFFHRLPAALRDLDLPAIPLTPDAWEEKD